MMDLVKQAFQRDMRPIMSAARSLMPRIEIADYVDCHEDGTIGLSHTSLSATRSIKCSRRLFTL